MSGPNNPTPKRVDIRTRLIGIAGMVAVAAAVVWIIFQSSWRIVLPSHKRESADNLKRISKAIADYQTSARKPPAGIAYDKDGRPLHSWRVLILPFLGEEELFKRFKLNEPWDSPHNIQLLPNIPRVYAPPVPGTTAVPFATYYQSLDGYCDECDPVNPSPYWKEFMQRNRGNSPGGRRTFFFSDPRFGLQQVIPPTSDTAVFVGKKNAFLYSDQYGPSDFYVVIEAGEAVPWTKPADLTYDADAPLPKLGGLFRQGFHAVDLNGTVKFVSFHDIDEEKLRKKITPTWFHPGISWQYE